MTQFDSRKEEHTQQSPHTGREQKRLITKAYFDEDKKLLVKENKNNLRRQNLERMREEGKLPLKINSLGK